MLKINFICISSPYKPPTYVIMTWACSWLYFAVLTRLQHGFETWMSPPHTHTHLAVWCTFKLQLDHSHTSHPLHPPRGDNTPASEGLSWGIPLGEAHNITPPPPWLSDDQQSGYSYHNEWKTFSHKWLHGGLDWPFILFMDLNTWIYSIKFSEYLLSASPKHYI